MTEHASGFDVSETDCHFLLSALNLLVAIHDIHHVVYIFIDSIQIRMARASVQWFIWLFTYLIAISWFVISFDIILVVRERMGSWDALATPEGVWGGSLDLIGKTIIVAYLVVNLTSKGLYPLRRCSIVSFLVRLALIRDQGRCLFFHVDRKILRRPLRMVRHVFLILANLKLILGI